MRQRHIMTCVTLLAAVGFMAGCGSDTDTTETPSEHPSLAPFWKEKFDLELELAELRGDDLTLEVLADYWVTDDEWQTVQDLFYQCMADHDLRGWIGTQGDAISFGPHPSDTHKAIEGLTGEAQREADAALHDIAADCTGDTVRAIGLAYAAPRANPNAVSREEAVARCLTELGHDDLAEMTFEELLTLNQQEPFDDEIFACLEGPTYSE